MLMPRNNIEYTNAWPAMQALPPQISGDLVVWPSNGVGMTPVKITLYPPAGAVIWTSVVIFCQSPSS